MISLAELLSSTELQFAVVAGSSVANYRSQNRAPTNERRI